MAAAKNFLGTHPCKLDDKDRVAVPAKFRDQIPEGPEGRELYLIPGACGCIEAYPFDRWQTISKQLEGGPLQDKKLRTAAKLLFAHGAHAVPDGQGRVRLTEKLKAYAGIKEECVVVGGNDHIEFWSPEKWAAFESTNMPDLDALLDSIAHSKESGNRV